MKRDGVEWLITFRNRRLSWPVAATLRTDSAAPTVLAKHANRLFAVSGDICHSRGSTGTLKYQRTSIKQKKTSFSDLNNIYERIHPIRLLSGKWEAEAIDTATEITSDCSLARVEESTNSGERKEQQWSRRRQWGAEAIDTQLGAGETSAEVFTSFWELQKLDFRMSDERYCRKRRAAEFRA